MSRNLAAAATARQSCYIPSPWPPRPIRRKVSAWTWTWRLTLALLAGVLMFLSTLDSPRAAPPPVSAKEAEKGGLYFPEGDSGLFRPAPLLDTAISIDVSGPIARYRIVHKFRNPDEAWVEGIYVFPLPEDSAVDKLRLRIGQRVIEGRIEEKQKARRIYQQAKQQGRKASLVEQERPNIFTTSVANIGPGEEIAVEIQFQEVLRLDGGSLRLRLPLVVGPRYIPGSKPVAGFGGAGWAVNTDQVPDVGRITPPVRRPEQGKDNPVRLMVRLDAGFPLASVSSNSHAITVSETDGGRREITLKQGDVPADRDFVLEWKPQPGTEPQAGLFRETVDGHDYLLLMLLPPELQKTAAITQPREVIFVIDTSGSMHGPSLAQAKLALNQALDRLGPNDRFNIVEFNSTTGTLFRAARPADRANVTTAHNFVDRLNAEGGTEMMGAIDAALDGRTDTGRVRQVIFITDGAVGNEAALLQRINAKLADSRLFTVGIGSAPNGFFMTEAARSGRGSYTFINDTGKVAERMQELYRKLENPALTDIRLTLPTGMSAEVHPDPIPDLYAGEPLLVSLNPKTAQGTQGHGDLKIAGRLNGAVWHTAVPLGGGQDNPGVGKIWARGKIASLMGSLRIGGNPEAVRAAVLNTALTHQLVSAYTSLVAVDVSVSRPADKPVDPRAVPTNMPHGWSHGHVFGPDGKPQPAPMPTQGPAKLQMKHKAMAPAAGRGATSFAYMPGTAMETASARGVAIGGGLRGRTTPLPQTATPAAVHAIAGIAAILTGLLLLTMVARREARMSRRHAGMLLALGLLAGGLWQLGEAGYIHGKALLAQYLLRSAWAETVSAVTEPQKTETIHHVEPVAAPARQVRPWPWADTWPVARLRVPRLKEDLIVLAGANGRTLAFGPGLHDGGAAPGTMGHTIITAHRDTHFTFLRFLYPGDEIRLTVADGRELGYRVRGTRIVHAERARLVTDTDESLLTLVTCFPFDAIDSGTPLRFLVSATAIDEI